VIAGSPADAGGLGAAWVFVRSGDTWSQQGSKLKASDSAGGTVMQGQAVALSADGNTALVGGIGDAGNTGAAWVYVRIDGRWAQQGIKLRGNDAVGGASQGRAVALSADGNTALVGGSNDNSGTGAVWVFRRNNGIWGQIGSKLVPNDGAGFPYFGSAIALSADGTSALIGGYNDAAAASGAVWSFALTNGTWQQQGAKLSGTGASAPTQQGFSVAMSAEAGTAVFGGPQDATQNGAVWFMHGSGTSWNPPLSKEAFSHDATGTMQAGTSVALSADGSVALIGAPGYNGSAGIFWVQSGAGPASFGLNESNTGAFLGQSVALSADGSVAVIGGYNAADNGIAAWIFVP
jgi:hypothetical protein